jgi:hypothetical protein
VAGNGFNGNTEQAFIGTPAGSAAIPLASGWSYALGIAIDDYGFSRRVQGDIG